MEDETIFCQDSDIRRDCMNNATIALQSTGEPFTSDHVINEAMKLLEWADNGCAGICQPCMKAMSDG